MKTAIYPGSFDPVTSGHLDIIRRAANIFDKLIVCVMVNAGKHPMFSLEERVELIRRVTQDLPNVEVDGSSELLAEYARRRGSCVVVKGLRAGSDFENEFQMALINRKIYPELDHVPDLRQPVYVPELQHCQGAGVLRRRPDRLHPRSHYPGFPQALGRAQRKQVTHLGGIL